MKCFDCKGDSEVAKTDLYIIADRTMNNIPFRLVVIQRYVMAHTFH